MPIARQNMKDWGAQCSIIVDGARLPANIMRLLKSVQVVHERGKATSLSVEFSDWDYEIQNKWIKPNSTIYVTCGWRHELRTKGPFKITEYSPSYPDAQAPSLSIKGASAPATKMNLSQRTKSYNGKTAKEVFEEVASRYNLKLEWIVQDGDDVQFSEDFPITQAAETDKQLLARVASKMGGYIWGSDGGILFVQPPEHAIETVQLNYRIGDKTIMSFTPEIKVFVSGGRRKGKKTAASLDMFAADSPISQVLADSRSEEDDIGDEFGSLITGGRDLLRGVESLGTTTTSDGKEQTFTEQAGALLNSILPDISKENETPTTRERYGPPSQQNYVGLNQAVGDVYKFISVESPREKVEGNAVDATATTDDQLNRQLTKASRKTVVAGGTLVPTFPSWAWTAREAVYLNGLSTLTSSRFEVAKATLTYDNSKGLQTVLDLKSHMPDQNKRAKKKEADKAVDLAENLARPIQNQQRDIRMVNPITGKTQRATTSFGNESRQETDATIFYLENNGANTSRVKGGR